MGFWEWLQEWWPRFAIGVALGVCLYLIFASYTKGNGK